MTEHNIYEAIAKKLSGEPSTADEQMLAAWLEAGEENRATYHALQQEWKREDNDGLVQKVINQDHLREKIWKESFGKRRKTPKTRQLPTFLLKIAASILIFLVAGWIAWKLVGDQPLAVAEAQKTIKENPKGQKSKIFLPDGSTVWLNAASRLSYHTGFSDSLRLISLNGEAYFDVAKDISRPFVVESRGVRIVALGTSFNINSNRDGLLDVSLVHGKVRVTAARSGDEVILSPGEYSTFDQDGKLFKKGHFDQALTTSWKDGILCFKNAKLTEITHELEQWYGVKVINGTHVPISKHFTGRFDNENLDNVLRNISFALGFKYELNGNKVTIRNP